MLTVTCTDTKGPSLVVSYLPNVTSASQLPMMRAESDETNFDVATNVGETKFTISALAEVVVY